MTERQPPQAPDIVRHVAKEFELPDDSALFWQRKSDGPLWSVVLNGEFAVGWCGDVPLVVRHVDQLPRGHWLPARPDAGEQEELERDRLRSALSKQQDEIGQILGKALGYPKFSDDQKNFPGATEADGVCVGEHVAESLAEEAAKELTTLRKRLAIEAKVIGGPGVFLNPGYYGEYTLRGSLLGVVWSSPTDVKVTRVDCFYVRLPDSLTTD